MTTQALELVVQALYVEVKSKERLYLPKESEPIVLIWGSDAPMGRPSLKIFWRWYDLAEMDPYRGYPDRGALNHPQLNVPLWSSFFLEQACDDGLLRCSRQSMVQTIRRCRVITLFLVDLPQ